MNFLLSTRAIIRGAVKANRSKGEFALYGVPCDVIFVAAALGLCWVLFFNAVQYEWRINPEYSYGYIIPLLGLVLIWCRWPDRPAPVAERRWWTVCVTGCLLFVWLPWDLFIEANPEWRLLYWFGGFQTVGLSLCLLYWIGGRKWVLHFAMPLMFMLIAAPWPTQFEQFMVQGLMRFVAGLTVGLVGFLGIPAVQHGNLIEVVNGIVGIDEACSGVRSLQSALMLSLFLGELNRFSLVRRIALLASSIVFVLVANLFRTTFLVQAAARHGLHQMQTWHDPAGWVVMIVALVGLLLLAHLMRSKSVGRPAEISTHDVQERLWMPPVWFSASAIVWLAVAGLSTEFWYRAHESNLVANERWSVDWPVNSADFKITQVPEASLAILRCSDSEAAAWQDASGNRWSGFLLRWRPGRNSAQLAKGHRPDICFPAAGAQLLEDHGLVTVSVGGVHLPFHYQTFNTGQTVSHVFYCLWSDRRSPNVANAEEDGSVLSRVRAVVAAKRNLGQQVIELVVETADSSDAVIPLFSQTLPALIHLDANTLSQTER
jgi:exosortase